MRFDFSQKKSLLTVMFSADTEENAISTVKKALKQGAEGFCFLTESLLPEYKTKKSLENIIAAMEDKPLYVTNYIRDNSQPYLSDDELAEQLLEMVDLGACLIDVRGDMFCRTVGEFTYDTEAVKKQKELISKIHSYGAAVIMSSHIFEYRKPENILKTALTQQERGADVAKIVTEVNSDGELSDAFETLFLLKKNLSIPFLFLCNGTACGKHRMLSSYLGNCMTLCLENSKTGQPQPTIEEAKTIRGIINQGGKINE